MAADLHIHIFEGITEQHLRDFFCNTFGSKYFRPRTMAERGDLYEIFKRIEDTPNIHVGEVSWLKAAVFENPEVYVPRPVQEIHAAIGEDLPVIDDALIGKIAQALVGENKTTYTIEDALPILAFLKKHKGKRCFTVSW